MDNWYLEIDSRERGLFKDDPSIIKKQLQVGDIQLRCGDTLLVILERKTISDLLSSLKDGRYSEQKKRLVSSDAVHKGYILEVSSPQYDRNLPFILWQIILRLQFKDRLVCLVTSGIKETESVLLEMVRKFQKDKKMYTLENNTNAQPYVESLHISKKENMTPERCFIMQLCQIPGISFKTASVITQKCSNLCKLIDLLKSKTPQEVKDVFSCPSLGFKKIESLKKYFMLDTKEAPNEEDTTEEDTTKNITKNEEKEFLSRENSVI